MYSKKLKQFAINDLETFTEKDLQTLYHFFNVSTIADLASSILYAYSDTTDDWMRADMRAGGKIKAGTLEKNYMYIRKLGSGNYGSVWLAIADNCRYVAIKVYDIDTSDKMKLAIASELEVLRTITESNKLCSQYAVCLIDYYESNGTLRIVTDYVKGPSFDKHMFRLSLTKRTASNDIMHDLILGMDLFHNMGITHQDITGPNIIWDVRHKHFRYLDWGIACLKKYCNVARKNKIICDEGKTGGYGCGLSGSLYTMPPELKYGMNDINFDDAKAHDIWSLGIILLEWYTLKTGQNRDYLYLITDDDGDLVYHWPNEYNQDDVKKRVAMVKNPLAKRIIPLLLAHDPQTRNENWPDIVNLIAGQDTAHDVIRNVLLKMNITK